ncbi:phage gateway protein [Singulisphaera sp. PoT]|uniref:phage gateway protein n=1 Tax=Singulisphaera sp. PoT TaxID=3411797 RepID=UPI003BF5DAEF
MISAVIAGEAVAGIPGTPIKQAFQPTLQGANTQPTAYLHKIGDRRVGSPRRSDVWDQENGVMLHTELQKYETTFQMSALATQDPKTPTQYTASDILNLIASILQSSTTIAAFEAQGVGILRVAEVRNPYFLDDRMQNEASPSLDFTLTHDQVVASAVPVIAEKVYQILTV